MRYRVLYFLFFLIIGQKASAQISISGEIKNAPDSTEVLIYYYNDNLRLDAIVIGNSVLDESGIFNYTSKLIQRSFGYVKIGEYYEDFYFCPGDEISIYAEYNNFNTTLDITSKYKSEQLYLHEENLKNYTDKIKSPKAFKNAFTYKSHIENIEKENFALFKQFQYSFVDSFFTEYKFNELKYKYIYYKAFYIVNNKYENKAPKEYYNFIDSIDFNYAKMLKSNFYFSSISLYLHIKYGQYIPNAKNFNNLDKAGKRLVMQQSYDIIKSNLTGEVRDFQISDFVKYNLQDVKTDSAFVKSILKDYYSTCTNKEYVKYIRDLNTKISKQNGSVIPNYTLQNKFGEKVSLHSLKGKYIYIDFWASWCYPCKVYLKDYPALQAKYAEKKDIVYLFINVMDDKNKWSDFILNNPTYGTNWFADEITTKKIRNDFDLDAIPRYMIIDKNLKIIDVDADIPKRVVLPK